MGIFSRKNQKQPDLSPNVDWDAQAIPAVFTMKGGQGYVNKLKKQNIAKLTQIWEELLAQASGEGAPAPKVIGYWAVSKETADDMEQKGIPEHLLDRADKDLEMGLPIKETSFIAWDSIVAGRALQRAGGLLQGNQLQGDVRVVKVAMGDAKPNKDGLLQWDAPGDKTDLLAVYTPEQFSQELQHMHAFAGLVALQGPPEDSPGLVA